MESIAFIVNRNFILVGVDTNYHIEFGGTSIHSHRAKKVYIINDHNLISVIGNPYKIINIYKYILKLNELENDNSFDEIVEDLMDVFNLSETEFLHGIKELANALPEFSNPSGSLNLNKLMAFLQDKPDLLSIFQDTKESLNEAIPIFAQIYLLGWDSRCREARVANFISVGQNLKEGHRMPLLANELYIRMGSSSLTPSVTSILGKEFLLQPAPLLSKDWDSSEEEIALVLDYGRKVLKEALIKISPYKDIPQVVFYELSYRTNFLFREPQLSLQDVLLGR